MASENAIIERAEMYLRKLSCGVNPLTDEILPEGDSCKQERISRCLAYVASLLQQQLNHDQVAPVPSETPRNTKRNAKPQMQELSIDAEALKRYRFFDYPVSISRVVRNINELLPNNMNHLLYADVANFLVQEGILSRQVAEDGKEACRRPPARPTDSRRANRTCADITTFIRNAGSRPSSTFWTTSRNASL